MCCAVEVPRDIVPDGQTSVGNRLIIIALLEGIYCSFCYLLRPLSAWIGWSAYRHGRFLKASTRVLRLRLRLMTIEHNHLQKDNEGDEQDEEESKSWPLTVYL